MDKESIYELQKIDCNCNDCGFMIRDFDKFNIWKEWNRKVQLADFERRKVEAFKIANSCTDPQGKVVLLKAANKMAFQFDQSVLINYGQCSKFNKGISWIPNICQIETQKCFIHRKESVL